jgi:hypothetical protein
MPISLEPMGLAASYLKVIINPSRTIPESTWNNNWKTLPLAQVRLAPTFYVELADHRLDQRLKHNVLRLAAHLAANNLVTGDIVLNDGVRDPAIAHRWSTSWSIRHRRVPLRVLQQLQNAQGEIGVDEDGNRWYDHSWEEGLPRNRRGLLTRNGLSELWKRIDENALALDNRSTPNAVAAEGYAPGDPRRLPNTYNGVSKHVRGLAIDVTIPWRAGAKAGTLLTRFGLRRPVKSEPWHFELR